MAVGYRLKLAAALYVSASHFVFVVPFTEKGDGAGQIFSLASSAVQLNQPLHQVAIATPAITNLALITHTPEKGRSKLMILEYTFIHTN